MGGGGGQGTRVFEKKAPIKASTQQVWQFFIFAYMEKTDRIIVLYIANWHISSSHADITIKYLELKKLLIFQFSAKFARIIHTKTFIFILSDNYNFIVLLTVLCSYIFYPQVKPCSFSIMNAFK